MNTKRVQVSTVDPVEGEKKMKKEKGRRKREKERKKKSQFNPVTGATSF